MKTWKKVLLLIAILLLALGATLTQLAHRRGDSYLANLSFGVSGNYGYDQKGYTVCRSGEADFAAKDVRAISLDWNAGSVTVERYSGSTVLVREEAKRALKEDECLRYKLSGGELSIQPRQQLARKASDGLHPAGTRARGARCGCLLRRCKGIRRRDREGDPP